MTVFSFIVLNVAGRVILLNGASSSGKSSLAVAIQVALPEPFLRMSPDLLRPGIPRVLDDEGRRLAWWTSARPKFLAGFIGAVAAMAAAGNDLIVELIVETAWHRQQFAHSFAGGDVYVVGVHCDLAEIERREIQRGDRRIGEGRADIEQLRIHAFGAYDLDVDTTTGHPADIAPGVIAAWNSRGTSVLLE